ncbi:substrate-binding domain-containing protein [Muricomes sp. OA1]|nr:MULTISPECIES: substrate-binding domain-containing protein [Clostridia]MCH1974130.1 substrate-binding domain-containing protein [Muricomes sp. OA1]MEE0201060.1 substrate-binding domain-containing protein [Muricomes sp.]MRM87995.1 sugar ABC transporter substrate-binding protein [Faecalicatena contorta]
MKKRIMSIFMCICVMGTLAACQPASQKKSTETKSTQASNATGESFSPTNEMLNTLPEEPIGEENEFEGLQIALSQRNIAGSEWYEQLVRVAQLEAEHLGVKLTVYDGEDDITKQMGDIETAVNMKMDAIIVNPKDSSGLLPAIEKVHNAGIPLTVVNSAMSEEAAPFTFVSADVENSGYQGGFELAKAFDEKYGWKDSVKALVLSAAAQEKESDLRRWGQINGYNDYMLEKYGKSNLDIVAYQYYNWQPEPAMTVTTDVLQANPDLDIIFSACDGGCQGVVSAIESAGKTGKIMITSIDGRKSVLKWIKDGDKGVASTVSNDPRIMGKWAVYLAAQQASGVTTPATFNVPNTCYTKSNVDDVYDPDSTY